MNPIDRARAGLASGGARPAVAVLGAGTIGAGWAAFFALSGLEVRVADPAPQAKAQVQAALEPALLWSSDLARAREHRRAPCDALP